MAIAYTATSSPCNNVCQMDEDWGVCVGCYRTLDEIVSWSKLTDPEKIDVLAQVKRRSNGQDLPAVSCSCACAKASEVS
jgi:predicted Fe-S protein YdhL (DUF1289 family)